MDIDDCHIEEGVFIEIRLENKYLNFETYNNDDVIVYSIGNRFENINDYIIGDIHQINNTKKIINNFKDIIGEQ